MDPVWDRMLINRLDKIRNLAAMAHGGRVEREIYNWQQYGELGARDFISTLRNCGIKPNDLESLAKLMRETS